MALPAGRRTLLMSAAHVARSVRAWPVASQQRSRRNAMLACTSLTQRRMERRDVEDFLASLHPALPSTSAGASAAAPAPVPTPTQAVAHG